MVCVPFVVTIEISCGSGSASAVTHGYGVVNTYIQLHVLDSHGKLGGHGNDKDAHDGIYHVSGNGNKEGAVELEYQFDRVPYVIHNYDECLL